MKRAWKSAHHFIELEVFGLEKNRALAKAVLSAAEKTLSHLPKNVTKQLENHLTYSLGISFISKTEMRKINKKYRKKNKPTDVLSFSRLEGEKHPTPFPEVGDVLISLEVAKAQAKEYQTTLKEEVERLTVHGVLHLFGYDHELSPKEEKRMFSLQEKILKGLQ